MQMSDVHELATGIEHLARWLRRSLPNRLSMSSLTALDRLQSEGPLRVSSLAASEAMTQPGVTLLVNRLESEGYAERVPDPTDRRASLVRITADGSRVLSARQAERSRLLRERITGLDADDQRALAAALPAIQRLLAEPSTSDTSPAERGTTAPRGRS